VLVKKACAFWDFSNGRIELTPGQRVDLAPEHAIVGMAEAWLTPEDAADGAPPREKVAARKAPETK
jgi:hypothetical protein